MKRLNILIILIAVLALFVNYQYLRAQGAVKDMNVGYLQQRVADSGDEGEGVMGWANNSHVYYDGYDWRSLFSSKAQFMGCKNWTDTLGNKHSIKVSGHGQWESDDRHIWIPIPDEAGWTVHRYMRFQPPTVVVDGLQMSDPYPFNLSDHADPSKIPGNADIMTESFVNTDMGVSIHMKAYGFRQPFHDDYVIFEWTFKNTGNVDLDDEIELNQTIENWHYIRQIRQFEEPRGMVSSYGEMPGDSLWLIYGYPSRGDASDWDNFGAVNSETGHIEAPFYVGETILFTSAAVNDMVNNDENQPFMTGYHDCDLPAVTRHSLNLTDTDINNLYTIMSEGFNAYDGQPELDGAKPGHHSERFDERGFKFYSDYPHLGYTMSSFWAIGPFDLAPGDSIKVVWAPVMGMIDAETGWEVGQGWMEGTLEPPPGMDFALGIDNLPPHFELYPELYAADQYASEEINWAKDCWVATGKDSLFRNATAANWAYQNGLTIPEAPPPPSITVTSLPDKINIEWTNESESAGDFSGYRVYRAKGSWVPTIPYGETEFIGGWELVYETTGSSVHSFDDTEAQRGIAYFYYVTAFDDGTQNPPDYDGKVRSLESSMFANMTTKAAYLTRPAEDDLSNVVIVPNPYNISASQLQFTGEPDKIMFYNLPIECKIRIYTESGDLVQEIDHYGSGDSPWGDVEQEHSATLSDQIIVSGIYLVHFKTPDGKTAIKKLVVVR